VLVLYSGPDWGHPLARLRPAPGFGSCLGKVLVQVVGVVAVSFPPAPPILIQNQTQNQNHCRMLHIRYRALQPLQGVTWRYKVLDWVLGFWEGVGVAVKSLQKTMSQLYARVFTQILDSSIAEDFETRHVFEDFLKVCTIGEYGGIVDMTRSALARKFNMPLENLNRAIERLEAPDPSSRNTECEGRRLVRLDDHRDWGWRIVNWAEYDKLRTRADTAARVANHRKAKDAKEVVGKPSLLSKYHPATQEVLEALNRACGRVYRPVEANLAVISARLNEPGVSKEGVFRMVEAQVARWKGSDMEKYLRPETLFGATKFQGYYAMKDEVPKPEGGSNFKEIRENLELPLVTIEQFTAKMEALKAKQRNPYEPIPPRTADEA